MALYACLAGFWSSPLTSHASSPASSAAVHSGMLHISAYDRVVVKQA